MWRKCFAFFPLGVNGLCGKKRPLCLQFDKKTDQCVQKGLDHSRWISFKQFPEWEEVVVRSPESIIVQNGIWNRLFKKPILLVLFHSKSRWRCSSLGWWWCTTRWPGSADAWPRWRKCSRRSGWSATAESQTWLAARWRIRSRWLDKSRVSPCCWRNHPGPSAGLEVWTV